MKKTLPTIIAISTLATASPAFAHHGGTTGFFSNLAHWLSSPMHSAGSIALIGAIAFLGFKLIRKNSNV